MEGWERTGDKDRVRWVTETRDRLCLQWRLDCPEVYWWWSTGARIFSTQEYSWAECCGYTREQTDSQSSVLWTKDQTITKSVSVAGGREEGQGQSQKRCEGKDPAETRRLKENVGLEDGPQRHWRFGKDSKDRNPSRASVRTLTPRATSATSTAERKTFAYFFVFFSLRQHLGFASNTSRLLLRLVVWPW